MMKRCKKSSLVLGSLVVGVLVFGVYLPAYSGGPEPPGAGEKISGKAITAILTAVQISINNWPVVVQVVVGECNGAAFQIGPIVEGGITSNNIGTIVEADLLYQRLPDAGIPECYSASGGEELIITKVTDFYNSGTAFGAIINLQMIQ